MKRFTIPCDFGGQKAPFHIYVGKPAKQWHPLYFQSLWLTEIRGGQIPLEVVESFKKLQDIAIENNVSFEELCVYALGTNENKSTEIAPSNSESGKINKTEDDLFIENRVITVAAAGQLKHLFDEDFDLLFINCKNQLTEFYHAFLFVRTDEFIRIKELVEEEKITIEELNQHGYIEYQGKGGKPNLQIIENIVKKYGLYS